jgi:hypothetical protein
VKAMAYAEYGLPDVLNLEEVRDLTSREDVLTR